MTKYTAFRCPVDLLPKAQIKAAADRRSLSNYIVTLIEMDTADVVLPAKTALVASKKAGAPAKFKALASKLGKAKKTAKKA